MVWYYADARHSCTHNVYGCKYAVVEDTTAGDTEMLVVCAELVEAELGRSVQMNISTSQGTAMGKLGCFDHVLFCMY